MMIPVDGVAPILLAILPVSDGENHLTLLPHLKNILYGLIGEKIQVISYSCDGTEVKRKIQWEVLNKAQECLQ
jgi:hypothetical protein